MSLLECKELLSRVGDPNDVRSESYGSPSTVAEALAAGKPKINNRAVLLGHIWTAPGRPGPTK